MAGLGLDGLDGHASLSQAGEAGVAQLVAGPVDEARPRPRCPHDLFDSVIAEGLAPSRAFSETNSRSVSASVGRSVLM